MVSVAQLRAVLGLPIPSVALCNQFGFRISATLLAAGFRDLNLGVKSISIFTDGSSRLSVQWPRAPMQGGWGFVILARDERDEEQFIGYAHGPTVPGRVGRHAWGADSCGIGAGEVAAIAAALVVCSAVRFSLSVTVRSDSVYAASAIQCFQRANAHVRLVHLTRRLLARVRRVHSVGFVHVRAHVGEPFNELADRLAKMGRGGWWMPLGFAETVANVVESVFSSIPGGRSGFGEQCDGSGFSLYAALFWTDVHCAADPADSVARRPKRAREISRDVAVATANVKTFYLGSDVSTSNFTFSARS